MSRQPLQVVAIMSLGHSGSTLLDLMVSSHRDIVSVGEIHQLKPSYKGRCPCGAATIWECRFWKKVDTQLHQYGLSLDTLDINSDDPQVFRRDNIALLQVVSDVGDSSCIVDSSKSLPRLLRLAQLQEVELRIIQLTRSVFGVVYSHMKKGRRLIHEARRWSRHGVRMSVALRPFNPLCIDYEDLAEQPDATLRRVMSFIGIEFEPAQLDWAAPAQNASRTRHNVDGNRMRFSSDSTIRPDTQWRENLSGCEKALIGLVAGMDRLMYPIHFVHTLAWRERVVREVRALQGDSLHARTGTEEPLKQEARHASS